jgi:electron-transferring-flavoprotein dehydrogenase
MVAEPERDVLEVDVLIVGGGPTGLAAAIRLRQLLDAHNARIDRDGGGDRLDLSIALIEKGNEIGSHAISGAVLDPRALRELDPEFEQNGCPLESPVTEDSVWYLSAGGRWPFPIIPPPLRNHGNFVVSLGKVVRWMAGRAEAAGIDLLPGFAAAAPLIEGDALVGVRTGDKGIDRNGTRRPNFEPGIDIRAKVTLLCEGPRGTLTKVLVDRFKLDEGRHPQVYAVGIKEVWECPKGSLMPGRVIHTMGYPLDHETYGGSFIYHMADDLLDIGLVIGLDYRNPHLDPHAQFQRLKTHPAIRPMLKGAKILSYGAKAIPVGGYYAVPRPQLAGCLIAGDSASMLNAMRLKGIHTGMKAGMLAAETTLDALVAGDTSQEFLSRYEQRFRASWAGREMYRVRNFHAGFRNGLLPGLVHSALQMISRGRGIRDPLPSGPGHERMRTLRQQFGASPPPTPEGARNDGGLVFDRVTDIFHSGTKHEEDQPVHLLVSDTDICETRCREEYDNPCQRFCPAAVYEMVPREGGGKRLQINASNCVHCKTCDIMDPYQIITWVPPEGGGGPEYVKL